MRIFTFILFILLFGCAPQKQTVTLRSSNTNLAKDSVVYYETDFETRQKNYLEQMQGSWKLVSMQRQARLEKEPLSGTTLVFSRDMQFILTTTCGELRGNYDVKGTGIRFYLPAGTKNCTDAGQQEALIQLLTDRVSAYTVGANELLLRDNATNVVFAGSR